MHSDSWLFHSSLVLHVIALKGKLLTDPHGFTQTQHPFSLVTTTWKTAASLLQKNIFC